MSILLCCTCDKSFDTDKECEAEYFPFPKCQDCVYEELEKQHQEWFGYLKKHKYGC